MTRSLLNAFPIRMQYAILTASLPDVAFQCSTLGTRIRSYLIPRRP